MKTSHRSDELKNKNKGGSTNRVPMIISRKSKDRQYNDQKKDRQYNDQKKDRQYNDQKKDRQYNDQKDNHQQNTTQKTKDLATQTSFKTCGELRSLRNSSSSCSYSCQKSGDN